MNEVRYLASAVVASLISPCSNLLLELLLQAGVALCQSVLAADNGYVTDHTATGRRMWRSKCCSAAKQHAGMLKP
jgi:hypothetical protein